MLGHKRHVYVLLSTYNGAEYLHELLESIFQQNYSHFSLHIRDDGSTDSTLAIIHHFSDKYPNIFLHIGNNIGASRSFICLLRDITPPPVPAALFAFCDQDDYWLDNKLTQAVHALAAQQSPDFSLYCARQQLTNSQLQSIGQSDIPQFFGFENALVENVAIGCTIVFGSGIREKMLLANPEHMMMHDWWAYLAASAFGTVYYDVEATILYRQHMKNTVGWNKKISKMLFKSLGFFRNLARKEGLESLRQAEYFLHTYPELTQAKQRQIIQLLNLRINSNLWQRLLYIYGSRVRRNNIIENTVLRLTILFNLH